MIIRQLKLKLNTKQEQQFDNWLWHLTGVYNWAIRKIELDAKDGIYHSQFDIQNRIANHSETMGIPSHIMQGIIIQAHRAWRRCFKKLSKKPRLKGNRNKLNSIPFPDPIRPPTNNKIGIVGIGKVRFHKQELPKGKIKCGRIIKRASGWYLCLWIDAVHTFPVKETDRAVGIDPGFSTLLALSDGTKIENPRELKRDETRLAQAQRGRCFSLTARLQERQANRRRDRNHKISRKLIENYKIIYYSDDNFKGLACVFGKSILEAGLGQLIRMITYKGSFCGRDVVPINSKFTTMTCSACGALTGPTGWGGLAVRHWECSACGADHDRDINSAMVVLNVGAGAAPKEIGNNLNQPESLSSSIGKFNTNITM